MTRLRPIVALAVCLLAPAALAQGMGPEGGDAPSESPVTASLAAVHGMTAGNITATAELLDEDMYAYRPTVEVRTSGQLLAHLANAQYAFCSAASGEDSPNTTDIEETMTTKAEISAALADAFAYCEDVYAAMTDAEGGTMRNFFGQQMAASAILAFNTTHNYEHYGNRVTYMRLNGITPPSSQP